MTTLTSAVLKQWLENMSQADRDLVAMENQHPAGLSSDALFAKFTDLTVLANYAEANAGQDGFPPLPNGQQTPPAATTPAPQQPPEEQQPTTHPVPTTSHVGKQWLFFGVIVLVLLIGTFGGFFLYNEMTTSQEVVYFTYSSSAPLGVGDVVQVVQPCGDLQQLVVYHLSAMDIAAGQFEVPPVKEGCETRYVVTLEVTP